MNILEATKPYTQHCMASNDSAERMVKTNAQQFKRSPLKNSETNNNLAVANDHLENIEFTPDEIHQIAEGVSNYSVRGAIKRNKIRNERIATEKLEVYQKKIERIRLIKESKRYSANDEFELHIAQTDLIDIQIKSGKPRTQLMNKLKRMKMHLKAFEFEDTFGSLSDNNKRLFHWNKYGTTWDEYRDIMDICELYDELNGTSRFETALNKPIDEILYKNY